MAFTCFIMITSKAQLANTKWKGDMGIPQGQGQPVQMTEAVWDFKPDTVFVHLTGGEDEVMTYRVDHNILTFKKVSGGSQCDGESTGKYRYKITGNQFFITLVEDSCEGRAAVDFSKPFTKVD